MARIVTNRPSHLSSQQVRDEIKAAWPDDYISDAAALTIASYWQSPGTHGRAFAELSTTGSVDLEALVSDIGATMDHAMQGFSRRELQSLEAWANNHASVDYRP